MGSQPNQRDSEHRFDLTRFVEAQEKLCGRALEELRQGRKESHWMWFVFPQIEGLGSSSTSKFYAIKSVEEARAYLNHPILGPRLLECCEVSLQSSGKSAAEIFAFPDDLKLRSSMTLFACTSDTESVFSRVLARYFDGQPDPRTLELLGR